MMKSMTGFGKAELELPNKKVNIEIKTLNSKQVDLNTRMPGIYRGKDLEIRSLLSNKLERGKIDFSIYVEHSGDGVNFASRIESMSVAGAVLLSEKINDGGMK